MRMLDNSLVISIISPKTKRPF